MELVRVARNGVEERHLNLATVALIYQLGEYASRENFRDALFYGTDGALAVCDIERREPLHPLADWIRAVSVVTGGVPFRIVFNKVDRAKGSKIGPGIRLAPGTVPERADVLDERDDGRGRRR